MTFYKNHDENIVYSKETICSTKMSKINLNLNIFLRQIQINKNRDIIQKHI